MTSVFLLLSLMFDIRGVVVDPMGRPVPDAKITCGSSSTTSDQTGSFTVTGDQSCNASIEKEGFAVQSAALKPGEENSVSLTLASASEQVIVTATGAPVAIDEAGVSATVVTSADLQVRNMNRMQDLLRDIPGLTVVQTGSGGGTSSIFTRGGDSNATVVLLDGIPVTDPGGSINTVGLSTSGLDRIEVIRGPESALYGAEAASGVIQMFSKRGDPESVRPHGMLLYERGSFSTDHWTAGLNGGLFNRLDYSLTADQYRSTGQFQNNVFRNNTGTANLGFKISDSTTIRSVFRIYDSYAGAPGFTGYLAPNLDGRSSDRDSAVGVRLDDTRGSRFSQRAMFSYHRLRNISRDDVAEAYPIAALVRTEPGPIPSVYFVRVATPTTIPDPGTTLAVNNNYSTFPFGVSLNITDRTLGSYQGTVSHSGGAFIGQYDYERQTGLITGSDVYRRNNGISLYDQYAWRQRIFMSAGARIEHSSVFGTRFAPRGAVTFRLPTDTYLRTSLARGIKQPTLLESFASVPGVFGYQGNPNLQPAITDSFEVGLTREWWNRRIKTEAAYFRNHYTDLIQFITIDPVTFRGSWANVSQSRSRGVEVSGSLKITSFATVRGSYTKLNTRILGSVTASDIGRTLLRRPENSGTASLQIAPKRWNAIIGARFIGESRDQFAQFGINRLNAYNFVYMSVNWQATKNVAPFFAINNLFDEHYQPVNGYAAWDRNASGGLRITW